LLYHDRKRERGGEMEKGGGGEGEGCRDNEGHGTYIMSSTISEISQIPLFMGLYDVDMANNKLLF